ncbi:MAG: hypothetical protein OHK0038_24450 [Flammeovirgaceae bacterium]
MKKIYITWHYTTHGVAYLKHILSQFYLSGLPEKDIFFSKLDQEKLNTIFDEQKGEKFLFDEIVYLTAPQSAFDNLSSRRFSYKKTILEDELVKERELVKIFEEILENVCYDLEKDLEFVKRKYPNKYDAFQEVIWRNIHHYPIAEQIKWLEKYSNFKNVYSDKFKVFKLNVNNLRDEKEISSELNKWTRDYFSKQKDFEAIINVSLGSSETQVVWHILAEAGLLPENTRFIKTYDDKNDTLEKRFKRFSIQEIPIRLISEITSEFEIYTKTQSTSRELVNKKIRAFLESGFAILLIGERGIGKSQIASQAKEKLKESGKTIKGEILEANCASFADDTMAEAELFGYVKGAFTGATQDKKGLIESAENGILFLDEIHHLSKRVQAKLMKALQTDQNNQLSIRRLGENKERKVKDVRLIFATNQNVEKLHDLLLSDFYDRIVQHVIHIPPLRETLEDREQDWEKVWKGLKFKGMPSVPKEPKLMQWLKKLPLYGNYRDLQKIAMYYNIFNQFDDDTKKMLKEKTAFEYAKNEFEKYHSPVTAFLEKEKYNFNTKKTTKEMIADYKYELQNWAVKEFGGRKQAIKHFNDLGDNITEKTFNDWKNKKSLKNNSKTS